MNFYTPFIEYHGKGSGEKRCSRCLSVTVSNYDQKQETHIFIQLWCVINFEMKIKRRCVSFIAVAYGWAMANAPNIFHIYEMVVCLTLLWCFAWLRDINADGNEKRMSCINKF